MGVVVAGVQPHLQDRISSFPVRLAVVSSLGVYVLGLLTTTLFDTALPTKFIFLGIAIAPLMVVLGTLQPRVQSAWLRPLEGLGVWLGTWSFTLYVFHLPILMIAAVAAPHLHIPITPFFSYGLAILVIAIAYPAYWVGEVHTDRCRTWALALLDRYRLSQRSIVA